MGDVKRLSVGISLDQWGNADPAIFDDEYGNYVEWATVDQLLRDVRVLQAEVEKSQDAHKENDRLLSLVMHDLRGRVDASKLSAIEACVMRARECSEATDNSGALTRWGGGGR